MLINKCVCVQESGEALNSCQSESRDPGDVTASRYFRQQSWDEPMTSRLLCTDVTANEICRSDCQSAADVHENTEHVTYVSELSNKSVPSFTDFHTFSSQLAQPHFSLELLQRGAESPDKENSVLAINSRDADFSGRNSSRSGDVYLFDNYSQRNAVASFPADTFHDPLITVAMFLVNSAINSAVRILVDDNVASKNLVSETACLVPTSNVSSAIQPSQESTEVSEDPIQAVASTLVSQVLSEIAKKRAVFECVEVQPGETQITPTFSAAQSHHSAAASCSDCESERKPTAADNHLESGATGNASGELMSAVAEAYLSSCCNPVEDLNRPPCDCNSPYDDFECASSSSDGGRLTFASDDWRRPLSPPFTNVCSPSCTSAVLNNNNVAVGSLSDVDDQCQCISDDPCPCHHLRHIEGDYIVIVYCTIIHHMTYIIISCVKFIVPPLQDHGCIT